MKYTELSHCWNLVIKDMNSRLLDYRFLTEKTPAGEATGWGTPYDGRYGERVEKYVILVFKRPG